MYWIDRVPEKHIPNSKLWFFQIVKVQPSTVKIRFHHFSILRLVSIATEKIDFKISKKRVNAMFLKLYILFNKVKIGIRSKSKYILTTFLKNAHCALLFLFQNYLNIWKVDIFSDYKDAYIDSMILAQLNQLNRIIRKFWYFLTNLREFQWYDNRTYSKYNRMSVQI